MVAKKSKSKRQTLQLKYKIVKRTKDHKKKLKKGAISKTRKKINESGIPSLWPYKEELLQDIQAAKDKSERLREEQKEKRGREMVGFCCSNNESLWNIPVLFSVINI